MCIRDRVRAMMVKDLFETSLQLKNVIPEEKILRNMKYITVADVFGAAINRIHNGESVSALFEF